MTMRRFRLHFVTAMAGALLALAPFPARAKEEFPREINDDLHLGYDPPCRLCHIQGTTGSGSVAEPFGLSMLAHGMTGSASSLPGALMALRADNTDSDGDGTPDITELVKGTDPNTPANVRLVSQDPRYGCTVAPADRSPGVGKLFVNLLAVAGAFLARARRRDPG
jgi:MYXO-CTERM domain-containing protein